jgi:hypothetical protein
MYGQGDEHPSIEYVRGRLSATYVSHKKMGLCYIDEVTTRSGRNYYLHGSRLSDDEVFSGVSIGEFNLSSPPLGYSSDEGSAVFVSRIPLREDWKQGLRPNNLVISQRGTMTRPRHHIKTLLKGCTLRNYPCFTEAVESVEDIYESRAFCPQFAVHSDGSVWYKENKPIGTVDTECRIKLDGKFFWMKEQLSEIEKDILSHG